MTEGNFDWLVSAIHASFGKPKPRAEILARWIERIDHIPDEAVHWIVDEFERGDRWPQNVPLTICDLYCRWLDFNPEKRAHREPCDHCDLEGYIRAWWYDPKAKMDVEFPLPCKKCQPLNPYAKFKKEIVAAGGKVLGRAAMVDAVALRTFLQGLVFEPREEHTVRRFPGITAAELEPTMPAHIAEAIIDQQVGRLMEYAKEKGVNWDGQRAAANDL